MSALRTDTVVVGAGVAGLAAASELRRAGLEVCLLERSPRPGGVVRSERVGGYLVEHGPNTVRVKAPMMGLLARHDLAERLEPARPASRLRFLIHQGRLEPFPMGPGAFVRTPLLSGRGKWRLLAEPFVRRGDPTGETVADFVRRRLGPEALERLVAPFLTGIFAGDEEQLGAEAVFPTLVAAERRSGSIVRGLVAGALRRRRPGDSEPGPKAPRGICSARGGLESLVQALAGALGETLWTEASARTVRREGSRFRVVTERAGGETEIEAERLVVALPASEAGVLLRELEPEAGRALERVAYAPVVSLSLGIEAAAVREPIRGFGFLVPKGEIEASPLLGCLFMSQLFAGRAPEGRELVTVYLGGMRRPDAIDAPDETLLQGTCKDLDRLLGLGAEPELVKQVRWRRAVAQPGPEHPRLLEGARRALAAHGPVVLAGSYVDGVSVADTIAAGLHAAAQVARA